MHTRADPPAVCARRQGRAQAELWPTPRPLANALAEVCPFDPDLLPETLRPWALDLAERLQVPVDYPAAALEAAQILGRYAAQIGPLTKGTWLHPAHLTDQNINWFRNRSSHDAAVALVDAAVGRVLARRILSGFFAPVLKSWGFETMVF